MPREDLFDNELDSEANFDDEGLASGDDINDESAIEISPRATVELPPNVTKRPLPASKKALGIKYMIVVMKDGQKIILC